MRERLHGIDFLRGLIMVFMALDHASFFVAKVHFSEYWGVPAVSYDHAGWMLTRVLSHLCAPGFFLLMGIGIVQFRQARLKAGWTLREVRRFLMTRGILLMLLQFFVVAPAWGLGVVLSEPGTFTGTPLPGTGGQVLVYFGVLSSLGASMVLGAWLAELKKPGLLAMAGLLTAGCYAIVSQWSLLHTATLPEALAVTPGHWPPLMVNYPVLPWLAVALLGMALGKLLLDDAKRAYRMALRAGLLLLATLVVLRLLDTGNYGVGTAETLAGWFTLTKYPPGLAFLCFTLGSLGVLLYLSRNIQKSPFTQPILVFGKTALFFYVLHLYVYLILGLLFPAGSGWGMMLFFWGCALVPLYFLSAVYLHFKSGKPPRSWWRLL